MQRQTPQRRAILSAVSAAQSPLTAEQVYAAVGSAFPRLALTTVYRSLDAYVDAGLVRRSIYDDGIARYEIAAEHRHFLICTVCKKSVPLSVCPFEQLEEQLVQETGFQISGHKMEFFGLCPECAKKARRRPE
jgi:Fur family ferric uptake transcriptional regulator